ncbi:MAG: HD domain-containing phosphohydrolase [Candidatus Omnitrophota bacterium]
MFNLSDIFDKHKKEKAQPPKSPEAKSQELKVSSVVSRKPEEADVGGALKFYEEAARAVKEVYMGAQEGKLNFSADMQRLSQELTDLLYRQDLSLLTKCFSDYPKIEDYLYYHALNVSILSLKLVSAFDFDQEKKIEFVLSALLHDIGLQRYLDIILKTTELTKTEYAEIKQHPRGSFELLSKAEPKLPSAVLETVYQEHERIDGSGYPRGLLGSAMTLNAKIIGLVDCFEALMHPRPYRKKYPSLEASKIIVDNKNSFEDKLIKALFEKIGIFPVGTLLRLNTKESGIVLSTSEESPLRPVVKIIFDADGSELKEPRVVDLSNSKVLFVSGNI